MIKLFLKAKHWQLFLLVMVVPIIIQFILFATVFRNSNFNGIFILILLIGLIPVFVLLGWFWAIAIGLNDRLHDGIKMNLKRFKLFWTIPLIYFSLLIFLFISNGGLRFVSEGGGEVGVIVLLHLLSMFSMFYCLNFCAKTLKAIELKRNVTFSDYASEFFLIWFFVIGIWVFQPKINAISQGTDENNDQILDQF